MDGERRVGEVAPPHRDLELEAVAQLIEHRRLIHCHSYRQGEILMAAQVFKSSIDYSQVRVHNEEFLPFDLQPDDTAMTPNGEILR